MTPTMRRMAPRNYCITESTESRVDVLGDRARWSRKLGTGHDTGDRRAMTLGPALPEGGEYLRSTYTDTAALILDQSPPSKILETEIDGLARQSNEVCDVALAQTQGDHDALGIADTVMSSKIQEGVSDACLYALVEKLLNARGRPGLDDLEASLPRRPDVVIAVPDLAVRRLRLRLPWHPRTPRRYDLAVRGQ